MTRKKTKSRTKHRIHPTGSAHAGPAEPIAADWSPSPVPEQVAANPVEHSPEATVRPDIGLDKRALDRISQRELGKVDVALRLPGAGWRQVKLWDFSSIGFGIVIESTDTGIDPLLSRTAVAVAKETLALATNDDVHVRVKVGAGEYFEVWCKVRNVTPWRGGLKVGLRRQDVNLPMDVGTDRRTSRRLPLAPTLALKARIRHPFIYGQWCGMAVSDLNRNLGFSFLSTDPSILVFEGMELRIHFELASFSNMPVTGRVSWVHASTENEVRFGVESIAMDWRLQGGLWDYLLYSRTWTPSMLRAAGFRSQRVKSHLRFRTVKTMEDYSEVLRLRRDAYVSAGKRPESTTVEEMSTALDGSSRILMARHHGVLVGSLTFTFPVSEETVLDSQAGFPGQRYPIHLPPKANLIEVSRLCIHSEYRGTDLLQGLFESGLKHFLLSDRHWLVTSATADLLPLYESIGFTRLKASYRHHLLNNKEHHLLVAHRSAILWGWGVGLLTWNAVFGDLIRHLMDQKLIVVPGWMRAIIRAKLALRPMARLLVDAKAKAAFRKHLESLRRNGRIRLAKSVTTETSRETKTDFPKEDGSLFAGSEVEIPDRGLPEGLRT